MEVSAGLKTSEGKLTIGGVLGLLGTGLTLAIEVVQDPNIPWYGKVTVVAIIILSGVAGQLGWTNARTNLKVQELQAKAAAAFAESKVAATSADPQTPPQAP